MDNEFVKIIKIVGTVVFTAFIYALPILLTLSFAFSWIPLIKFPLVLMNISSFIVICIAIYAEVED